MKWRDENTYGGAENYDISNVWDPFQYTTKLVQINQVVEQVEEHQAEN